MMSRKPTAFRHAFTLIEMLVVIAIIGILAAISMPVISNFKKGDAMLAASRQLLDDVERARRLAISQRTTVYMIFCPANFWNDPAFNRLNSPQTPNEMGKARQLWDKQLNAYTFVTLRSVGDQPGQPTPRYLSPWRTLPDGAFIALWKFLPRTAVMPIEDPTTGISPDFRVRGFETANYIPFPSEDAHVLGGPYVTVPFIAFNHLGQVVSQQDEYIPLAKGVITYARDANKNPTQGLPSVIERPPGDSTNAFMLVHIGWLTGRAGIERQEIQ